MALSSEQFLNQVVASELLTQEDVAAAISEIPDDRRPKDGEQLTHELVRQKKLTKYQAEQIYSGKGKLQWFVRACDDRPKDVVEQ